MYNTKEEALFRALADEKWEWRTVDALARESGMPEQEVRRTLEKYKKVIMMSSIPDKKGNELYTLRNRYIERKSSLKQALSFIGKKPFYADKIEGIQLLISALGDNDIAVRNKAEDALVKIGIDAVKLLLEALKNENPNMRASAARVLGRIGDLRARDALIEVSKKDSYSGVRSIAEYALKDIETKQK